MLAQTSPLAAVSKVVEIPADFPQYECFLFYKKIINKGDKPMHEVYDFLKKCGTYYLATVDNGKPRVRPFGTIDLFEGKLYIQTGKVKDVSKQLAQNPNIELCAFADGTWLRVSATAVEDDRLEPKIHMLDEHPSLKSMYSADDGNTQVFFLENATATFDSFATGRKVIEF